MADIDLAMCCAPCTAAAADDPAAAWPDALAIGRPAVRGPLIGGAWPQALKLALSEARGAVASPELMPVLLRSKPVGSDCGCSTLAACCTCCAVLRRLWRETLVGSLLLLFPPPAPTPAAETAAFCPAADLIASGLPLGCWTACLVGEQSKDLLCAPSRLGLPLLLLPCSNSETLSRVSSPSNAPTRAWLILPTSFEPMLCAVLGVLGCMSPAAPCCASPCCTASCANGLSRPVAAAVGLTGWLVRPAGLSGQDWFEYVSEGMSSPAARARDDVTSPTSNSTTPTSAPA